MKKKNLKVNHELLPIYDSESKILILGSIPSPKSREYKFYYAHTQNKFWKVLSVIFNTKIPNDNERKNFYLKIKSHYGMLLVHVILLVHQMLVLKMLGLMI